MQPMSQNVKRTYTCPAKFLQKFFSMYNIGFTMDNSCQLSLKELFDCFSTYISHSGEYEYMQNTQRSLTKFLNRYCLNFYSKYNKCNMCYGGIPLGYILDGRDPQKWRMQTVHHNRTLDTIRVRKHNTE